MFNLLLLVGAISPINGVEYPDGYDPSYFVENVPVLRDATSPDWTVLNTEFIYDPNAQPYDDEINSSTTDDPVDPSGEDQPNPATDHDSNKDNDSESAAIPENARTLDDIATYVAIISILSLAIAVLLYYCRKNRISYKRLLPVVLVFSLVGVFSSLIFSSTNAASDRYVAGPDSKNIYETVTAAAARVSGTPDSPLANRSESGYYTLAGTESDTYPTVFHYSNDGGSSDKNHVVFADKCWRITRTTESGGVRMVYYGEVTDYGTCEPFNTSDYGLARTDGTYYNTDRDSSIPRLDAADTAYSYGFYTYDDDFLSDVTVEKDDRASLNPYKPYMNAPAMLRDYKESDCYKRLMSQDYEGMQIGNSSITCNIDTGHQYYSKSFDYEDGHYYLIDSQDAPEFPKGKLWCSTSYNVTPKTCSKNPYITYTAPNAEDGDNPSDVVRRLVGQLSDNYICLASLGAVKLPDGRVDCGNSMEYYYYNLYGGNARPFKKITGQPRITGSGENDSPQKVAIEDWYERNLSEYTDRLADDVYCGGAVSHPTLSFSGSTELTYNLNQMEPSFSCLETDKYTVSAYRGNGKLKYPVALINLSDSLLVGTVNPVSWVSGDLSSITMSPATMKSTDTDAMNMTYRIFDLTKYSSAESTTAGNGVGAGRGLPLLPVITLANSNKVVIGDGSALNPFIIDGEKKPVREKNIKTFTVSDPALFDALVGYFSQYPDNFSFSSDEDNRSITVDVEKDLRLDLSNRGIADASELKFFSNIVELDLSYNELTKLPDLQYLPDNIYRFEGNHIRDMSKILEYSRNLIRGSSWYKDYALRNFDQNLVVYYPDPEKVKVPPILNQHIQLMLEEQQRIKDDCSSSQCSYFYLDEMGVGTNNIEFSDSFEYASVPDSEKHSYIWIDNLLRHFWDDYDDGK